MSNELEQTISYQNQAISWAQLARENPDAFEEMRLKLIDDFIKNAPADMQQRLQGLQWKIEHVRRRARNPAAAFIAISGMMWESTQLLGRKQQELVDLCTGKKIDTLSHNNSGKILNFKRVAKR